MRNERPRRLSEEIKKNVKQLKLTWTKSGSDLWNTQKGSGKFSKKWDWRFDNLCEFRCLSALEILNNCEVKKRQLSYKALYRCQERSGIYLAQTLKRNIIRWIKVSPLNAKDTAPSEVINDASQILKCPKQWWNAWNHVLACADSGIFTFLTIVILAHQNSIFSSSDAREKLKFWGAIVGTRAHVGTRSQICILGFWPYLMIWMHLRRSKWLKRPQNGGLRTERVEEYCPRRLSFLDRVNIDQASTWATWLTLQECPIIRMNLRHVRRR